VVKEGKRRGFSDEERSTYTCVRLRSWHSTSRQSSLGLQSLRQAGVREGCGSSPMSSQAKRLMKKGVKKHDEELMSWRLSGVKMADES
jgi:hypothetical protein